MKWIPIVFLLFSINFAHAGDEAFYRFTCMPEISRLEFSETEIDENLIYTMSGDPIDVTGFESKYGLYKDGVDRTHVCKFNTGEEWRLVHTNSSFSLSLDGSEVVAFHLALSRGFSESIHRLIIESRIIVEICGCNTPPFECKPVIGIRRNGTYDDKTSKKLPIDLKTFFTHEPQ